MKNDRKPRFDDVAVAVRYLFGAGGEAPRVVASGRGHLARRIMDIARENGVPVREDRVLSDALAQVPVGVEIPADLWEAMAEVLAHLYRLDGGRS
ncbi:MAG: EscU/YscU/HrcU family type III secretion system export apparatus switch protein [Candidatus Ozemobacteraceae bacterium]